MNSDQLLKIVQQYSRKSEAGYGDSKVTGIPDQKTVFVEQIEEIGWGNIPGRIQLAQ